MKMLRFIHNFIGYFLVVISMNTVFTMSEDNSTEILPTKNLTETLPTENSTEILPAENSTEILPTENSTEILPTENSTTGNSIQLKKLVIANNDFALKLYERLAQKNNKRSILFSPLSLGLALGTIFHGARGNTSEGLRTALGYDTSAIEDTQILPSLDKLLKTVLSTGTEYTLQVANKILVRENFNLNTTYTDIIKSYYQTSIIQVDFLEKAKIETDINGWVNEMTHGNIKQLIDVNTIKPELNMLVLNAAYFQARWEIPFDPKNTAKEKFFNDGLENDTTEVEFMHRTGYFLYTSTNHTQVLKIPYKGKAISMLIILPLHVDGLQFLQEELRMQENLIIQKEFQGEQVIVSLPKFNIEFSQDLSECIKSLGAEEAFDMAKADFSGMGNIENASNAYLSEVMHKATLDIDEYGTLAAAATGISMLLGAAFDPEPPVFRVDHPFMVQIIEEDTNMILFAGHVNRF